MNLGMTVLARLRGRHVNNLAGTTLDHDMPALPQRRTLHPEGRMKSAQP